jgi:hypothetical protein
LKLAGTTGNLSNGIYSVNYSYNLIQSSANQDTETELRINGTRYRINGWSSNRTADKPDVSGYILLNLSGINTLDIRFRKVGGGGNITISQVYLWLYRIE